MRGAGEGVLRLGPAAAAALRAPRDGARGGVLHGWALPQPAPRPARRENGRSARERATRALFFCGRKVPFKPSEGVSSTMRKLDF